MGLHSTLYLHASSLQLILHSLNYPPEERAGERDGEGEGGRGREKDGGGGRRREKEGGGGGRDKGERWVGDMSLSCHRFSSPNPQSKHPMKHSWEASEYVCQVDNNLWVWHEVT